jgi:hypothetical protein
MTTRPARKDLGSMDDNNRRSRRYPCQIPQTELEGLFQRFMLLEVSKDDRKHQLLEDYRWWFAEWG